jgi:uncharacterized protein YcfJ
MKQNNVLIGGIIAAALIATAAGAYYVGNADSGPKIVAKTPSVHHVQQQAQMQPQQPPCNDNNIVGTVAGGVAGGVIGNQFGSGSGKTAATIGGVVAGGAIGHEVIPTQNVTCR